MQYQRIILAFAFIFICSELSSQESMEKGEADAESYRLYRENKWTELLTFGKKAMAKGMYSPFLGMRTGYAAFILGNYSESLKQYAKVYEQDVENKAALYYCYWNNIYLNNRVAARYYAQKMPEDMLSSEKIQRNRLSGVNLEYSYKSTDAQSRGDAQYVKVGVIHELGYRFHWENAVALYGQTISEPLFSLVSNNSSIRINQKEYYTRLQYAASEKLSLIAGGHYLYTPFNNYIYNNYVGFTGIKLANPYVHIQALAQVGRIRDSIYQQLDAVISLYPLGHSGLYVITRGAMAKQSALTQIAGVKLLNKIWLEGNITIGNYSKLLGNDAQYIYDDIDVKKLRAGGSLYYLFGKTLTMQLHYIIDKKELYGRPNANYYQYSITGGLQWKF